MSMSWSEANEAIRDAKITIRQADQKISDMAMLVRGRLRSCGVYSSSLNELKRELRDWNIHTQTWKEK